MTLSACLAICVAEPKAEYSFVIGQECICASEGAKSSKHHHTLMLAIIVTCSFLQGAIIQIEAARN